MDIPVGADEVVLYRFDNGAQISRILGPVALLKHMGRLTDLPSLLDGRYVHFALEVPTPEDPDVPSVSVVLGSPSAAGTTMWNHLVPLKDEKTLESQWSLPYWAEFAEEVLIPDGELPEGNWGGTFAMPFWIDDAVYARMKDAKSQQFERQLRSIWQQLGTLSWTERAEENPLEANLEQLVIAYVKYVFGRYLVDPDADDLNELWINFTPEHMNIHNMLGVLPCFEYGTWHMTTAHDGMSSGEGHTLEEAFKAMRFGQVGFRELGGPLPASMKDEWLVHETEGAPTFDSTALEAYFLLDQPSPVLLPQASFLAWWRAL